MKKLKTQAPKPKTALLTRDPRGRFLRSAILAHPDLVLKLRRPTALRPTLRRPSDLGK